MALQDYAKLKCFYNNDALTQVTSLSHVTNSGNQRVDLLNEGLGGFTEGSGDVTIEVGFAVPIGGMEENFQADCANKAFVTMQFFAGKDSYIGRGKIDTVSIDQTVGSSVEGKFTWIGELKPME